MSGNNTWSHEAKCLMTKPSVRRAKDNLDARPITRQPSTRLKAIGANWFVRQVMHLLSANARRQARRQGVDYSFLFMQANGAQLTKIAALIDAGSLRTIMDRVFPFAKTNEAMAYVETGRAKGKVVIKIK